MYKIAENGIITLTAGDSLITPLYITYLDESGNELLYRLTDDDIVCFSIMLPGQGFNSGIVRKKYTREDLNSEGNLIVHITTEDTENLHPGLYYYEIKFLTTRNNINYVDTIVPKRKFFII